VYDADKRTLVVELGRAVQPGEEVVVRTESTCQPDDKTLEGVYFDYTPKGAPQTLITQCQQYGFQRIVPCVDTMTSKTFYTTTIVADERYGSLISNGDLAPAHTDAAGNVVFADAGAGRKQVVYHNHKVNMAPYLFFLGLGTYDVHRRVCEYPSGQTFLLELLCIPGVVERAADAAAALAALHDSIIWVHLNTGPEQHLHGAERTRIHALIVERERLRGAGGAGGW
jgi:aminopeptidase N